MLNPTDHVFGRLGWIPEGEGTRLSGGFLNYVWRVRTQNGTAIVKHSPPYVASNPSQALHESRVSFEAEALRALAEPPLAGVLGERIRAPRLLDFDYPRLTLVSEDLGEARDLEAWLLAGEAEAGHGAALGAALARLHTVSRAHPELAERFNNAPVQGTRHAVQYAPAGERLAAAGVVDAQQLGDALVDLGQRLQTPGQCLVMGDLWPRSVLVLDDGLGLIDWELCHWGRPGQDLGHLCAHLYMLGQHGAAHAAALEAAFLSAYRQTLGAPLDAAFGPGAARDCALHFAAELLARILGPFQAGYLYDGLTVETPTIQAALEVAVGSVRDPESSPRFTALR